jgi:hypothetical protein
MKDEQTANVERDRQDINRQMANYEADKLKKKLMEKEKRI